MANKFRDGFKKFVNKPIENILAACLLWSVFKTVLLFWILVLMFPAASVPPLLENVTITMPTYAWLIGSTLVVLVIGENLVNSARKVV